MVYFLSLHGSRFLCLFLSVSLPLSVSIFPALCEYLSLSVPISLSLFPFVPLFPSGLTAQLLWELVSLIFLSVCAHMHVFIYVSSSPSLYVDFLLSLRQFLHLTLCVCVRLSLPLPLCLRLYMNFSFSITLSVYLSPSPYLSFPFLFLSSSHYPSIYPCLSFCLCVCL